MLSVLLSLYFLIFPLGQLIRIEVVPSVVLQPVDLTAGVLVLVLIFANRGYTKVRNSYFVPFVVIALFTLFLNFGTVSIENFITGGFYLVRLSIYTLLFFAIHDIVRRSVFWKKHIPIFLISAGVLVVLFGFIQYIFYPDFKNLAELGWDVHYFRLASTFFDTGFAGILIVLLLILLSLKILDREIGFKGYGLLLPGIVALALTFSRASYLSFLVATALIYIVRRNAKFTATILVIFLISVFLLPRPGGEGVRLKRTSTVITRAENFNETLRMVSSKPLFGVGYDLLRYNKDSVDFKSHSGAGAASSLVFVLATTGVVGLLIYLSTIINILLNGLSNLKSSLGAALVVTLSALLVHSIFDNSLFYPWVLGWVAILAGSMPVPKESR